MSQVSISEGWKAGALAVIITVHLAVLLPSTQGTGWGHMSPCGWGEGYVIGCSQWVVGESDGVDHLIIGASACRLFPLVQLTYKKMVAAQWASLFFVFQLNEVVTLLGLHPFSPNVFFSVQDPIQGKLHFVVMSPKASLGYDSFSDFSSSWWRWHFSGVLIMYF